MSHIDKLAAQGDQRMAGKLNRSKRTSKKRSKAAKMKSGDKRPAALSKANGYRP